ncbi:MAG: 3-oxoacyl-[acyl-carrier protein] reductase [Ignavibacteriae bacterium]|nr:MAG: 3-oxoacyl-[acyl-carrier protein] reductase [Ignavibacteriota bacterium]
MDKEFLNKTFIITGASSGIGKATVELALQRGANVAATGRNIEELKKLHQKYNNKNLEIIAANITIEADRKTIVEKCINKFGEIDVLVNAAGIIGSGSIENTTLEQWDYMMDVNLRSTFRLIQIALPYLIKRKGNIVNVSSITGIRAFPNVLAYCVSKAGIDQLTHCAALELAPKGVRINSVNPGVVVTNLHKASGMSEETYNAFLEHSKTTHPLGRVGTAEEVAELILFLASEKAAWITGVSYSIDGGRAQTCLR